MAPRGRIPNSAYAKQRMARKLTTHNGRAVYARRKAIVEPVFGQMSTLQNAKQLLLRGLDQARGEWLLLATCHNLRTLHGVVGSHARRQLDCKWLRPTMSADGTNSPGRSEAHDSRHYRAFVAGRFAR